jgi:hypothetical protein
MDAAIAERPTRSHFSCNPVSLFERTGCNWPMNDNAKAMVYCNNSLKDNNPRTVYCEYHDKLAYVPRAIKADGKKSYR